MSPQRIAAWRRVFEAHVELGTMDPDVLELCDMAEAQAGEPVAWRCRSWNEVYQQWGDWRHLPYKPASPAHDKFQVDALYTAPPAAPAAVPDDMVLVPKEWIEALVSYNDNARSFFQIANRVATELGTHALQTNFGAFADTTERMLKKTHDITNKARAMLAAAPAKEPK